jgi:hypothetical protein
MYKVCEEQAWPRLVAVVALKPIVMLLVVFAVTINV